MSRDDMNLRAARVQAVVAVIEEKFKLNEYEERAWFIYYATNLLSQTHIYNAKDG